MPVGMPYEGGAIPDDCRTSLFHRHLAIAFNTSSSSSYIMSCSLIDSSSAAELPCILKISPDEIINDIRGLQSRSSPGTMGILVFVIKGNENFALWLLYHLTNQFMKRDTIPHSWKACLLVPIPKKRNKKEVTNYRGISIQSPLTKIIVHIASEN